MSKFINRSKPVPYELKDEHPLTEASDVCIADEYGSLTWTSLTNTLIAAFQLADNFDNLAKRTQKTLGSFLTKAYLQYLQYPKLSK